jgi:protein polybromo-1
LKAQRAAAVTAKKPAAVAGDDGETSECSSTTTDKDRQEDQGDTILFNQLEDLFTAIINAKDLDDRPLHTFFQLLPSRKKYPSYYEIIDNPIDLKMIAMKIQQGKLLSFCSTLKYIQFLTKLFCRRIY